MPRRKTSIAFLVAIELVMATTLALGVFALFSCRSERQRQTTELRQNHANEADQLALSLALPVWNLDRAQIDKIIESAMEERSIFAVVVRLADVNGTVHARQRDQQWTIQATKEDPATNGLLVATRNIIADGNVVGAVKVMVTPRFMEAGLRHTLAWIICNIVTVDVLLVVWLYILLWRLVLRPIKRLEQYAAIVSTGGGGGMTLKGPHFRGELENLRASLDEMIRLLKTRFEALQESEERYRKVVEHSPECVAVAVDERLVYLNPAGARMLGEESAAPLMGRSVYDLVPAEWHEHMRHRRREVAQGGLASPPLESQLLRTDGTLLDVESQAVPFVYAGQPAVLNLIRNVTARKHAEAERLQTAAREQQAREDFTCQLITSQEAERRRIAGELHDSLGQNLLLIKNRAQLALADPGASAAARAQIENVSQLAVQAIAEVRQISHDLHPYQLDHLGLTRALGAMVDNAASSTAVMFERKLDAVDDVFAGDDATNVYRVAQECLNNVLKHSQARRAFIGLERDLREVRLWVTDDGKGFPLDATRTGFGLRNIAQRVHILKGRLTIQSSASQGTRIAVTIPIAESA